MLPFSPILAGSFLADEGMDEAEKMQPLRSQGHPDKARNPVCRDAQ